MIEVLWEVRRITERRDGCTFRTEFVERRWVAITDKLGKPDNDPDLIWVSVTDLPGDQTSRIVPNKKG